MRLTQRCILVGISFLFFCIFVRSNYAYWVIENERLIWKRGDILGTNRHNSEYTYAFASEITPDPTETPSPTATPTDEPVVDAAGTYEPTATPEITITPTVEGRSRSATLPTNTPSPTPTSAFRAGAGGGSSIVLSPTPTPNSAGSRPFLLTPTPLPQWLLDRIFGSLFSGGSQSQPTPTPTQVPERQAAPTEQPQQEPRQTPSPTPTQALSTGNTDHSSGPVFATPTPIPTQAVDASSFFTKTVTAKEEVYVINTDTVREISLDSSNQVGPMKTSSQTITDARTALIQEELASRNRVSGISIRLDSSSGDSLSTVQDRFMIERANQIVTITNVNASTQSRSELEINSNNVVARSTMRLVVDTVSHVLTVETEQGKQRVSFMPDEAAGIIAEIKALDTTDPHRPILLTTFEGKLVYQITGSKIEKLIGIMPVAIQKQIILSADTGSVVRVESPLLFKLLSLLTF